MSLQDPISDMFTRIRNAQLVAKETVLIPLSKVKLALASVLKEEGYIADFEETVDKANKPALSVTLKYFGGRPVIKKLTRVSKPSLRVYKSKADLPKVAGGLGISIISTNEGLMTDREARRRSLGGEILCEVL